MAFGRPVIATRVGDMPEQLPKEGGLFIDADTVHDFPTELLNSIEKIASSQNSYEAGIKNAQKHALWPSIADKIYNFILKMLD